MGFVINSNIVIRNWLSFEVFYRLLWKCRLVFMFSSW